MTKEGSTNISRFVIAKRILIIYFFSLLSFIQRNLIKSFTVIKIYFDTKNDFLL